MNGTEIPSIVTSVAPVRSVPVMVTSVPPATGPSSGVSAEITGPGRKVYTSGSLSPPAVVTVTSTGPAACGGVTKVISVGLTWMNGTDDPSIVTAVASPRSVPAIVTSVPPAAGP